MEDKLSSLEKADLYLQESFKQLTDRTIRMETDSQKIETNLLERFREQHEVIAAKIQPQLAGLRQDMSSIYEEHANVNNRLDEIVDKFEESDSSAKEKIDVALKHLEEGLTKGNESIKERLGDMDAGNQQIIRQISDIEHVFDEKLNLVRKDVLEYSKRFDELDQNQLKQESRIHEISKKTLDNENILEEANDVLERLHGTQQEISEQLKEVGQKTKDNETKINLVIEQQDKFDSNYNNYEKKFRN